MGRGKETSMGAGAGVRTYVIVSEDSGTGEIVLRNVNAGGESPGAGCTCNYRRRSKCRCNGGVDEEEYSSRHTGMEIE